MIYYLERRHWLSAAAVLAVGLLVALVQCAPSRSALEQVLARGELHIVTRTSPATYYQGSDGEAGFEYELASRFADKLGVALRVSVARTLPEMFEELAAGHVNLAAAGLTITANRSQNFHFTPPYQLISQQLVYRLGNSPPQDLAAVASGRLEIVAHSSHAERLVQLAREVPDLRWHENPSLDTEELLIMVDEELIDYTIADSNEVAVARRFYPQLAVAFDISEPEPLAWAFPGTADESLLRAASTFIEELRASGELDQLLERYYGHIDVYDYAGTPVYMHQVRARLPRYRRYFEQAGDTHGIDWRLLAAMAYQESHWDPAAVSPTGVRGMMMLTQATAEYLGIRNRTDLIQSIDGGARYLQQLNERLEEQILEPDRTWMAVAAYNVGLGHLNDARRITRQLGGDDTLWKDVKENLPLLRERSWYKKTRHGYARGDEPVRYVENIRSYYDILVWMDEQERPTRRPSKAWAVDSPSL